MLLGNSSKKIQDFIAYSATTSISKVFDTHLFDYVIPTSTDLDSTVFKTSVIPIVNDTDIVYISGPVSAQNTSATLIGVLKPRVLIYSKSPTVISSKPKKADMTTSSSTSKIKKIPKPPVDPIANINLDDRYNLKEKGSAHLVSNGSQIYLK